MSVPYPRLGTYPVVPAADLVDKDSAINVSGPARVTNGSAVEGAGKHAGQLVIRDSGTPGASQYSMVIALGPKPDDSWAVVDGSTAYTPV